MKILEGGGKISNERHTSRDKFLVRDRIDKIIDPGYLLY
jgi:acetyl-CoA carboxylase carboxyltransferase component